MLVTKWKVFWHLNVVSPTISSTICHQNRYCPFDRYEILTLVLDHLAMDDSIWGNLFSADDPMAPQLEFRGGNGHTGKSIIIRSGTEPKPPTQNPFLDPNVISRDAFYDSEKIILTVPKSNVIRWSWISMFAQLDSVVNHDSSQLLVHVVGILTCCPCPDVPLSPCPLSPDEP